MNSSNTFLISFPHVIKPVLNWHLAAVTLFFNYQIYEIITDEHCTLKNAKIFFLPPYLFFFILANKQEQPQELFFFFFFMNIAELFLLS